ncbi:MAG TPA: toxin-antitoxin system HicB family antitoxin [Jatrophihabitans sp.]|nr:toxin-antitoxin system HicB family antitoxin [Jatrophihabitans sp.]
MHLDSHVAAVHDQLTAAAALGDDRTREIAASLATAAAPAVRLAILDAISAAADEITAALLDYPGSPAVATRLEGDEVRIEVRATAATEAEPPRTDDGEASARISLRLSEALKADIDAAAERDGVSVNTWLVRAATAALRPGPFAGFGSGAFGAFGPFGGGWNAPGGPGPSGGRRGGGHNITGWING